MSITGFEGVGIAEPKQLSEGEKTPIGFKGFVTQSIVQVAKIPLGFKGFCVAYSDTERFIIIQDYRGFKIKGVEVTAKNTSGDVSSVTDSSGIAALQIDQVGSTEIEIKKDKTFKKIQYDYSNEGLIKSIVLQPRLL